MTLRCLLLEQLTTVERARRHRDRLIELLFDDVEPYAVRHDAGKALSKLADEDWPLHVERLRQQGTESATRLAFDVVNWRGVAPFSDRQIVEVLLALDGRTVSPIRREDRLDLIGRFWRFEDKIPDDRIVDVLDLMGEYLGELLPEHQSYEEAELIDFVLALIMRLAKDKPIDPDRLWFWLHNIQTQHAHNDEAKGWLANWAEKHPNERRVVLRAALLSQPDKTVWQNWFRLRETAPWLSVNEDDVVALLAHLDPSDQDDIRWKDVLTLVPHDGQIGAIARAAALPFLRSEEDNEFIRALAGPHQVPDWEAKREAKERERVAERDAKFAEHRADYNRHIEEIKAGLFGRIHPIAMAYLKKFRDLNNDLPPLERVTDWLGEEVANAALLGFEAFLHRYPPRPSAVRMALTYAKGKRWNTADILIAALAERVRTRTNPFDDLPDERIMAGLFEMWNSLVDRDTDFAEVSKKLEAELRNHSTWECAIRLYIEPQMKRGKTHVDKLYDFMRNSDDRVLSKRLAREWLARFPNLPREPEEELIDRLLHGTGESDLRDIVELRRAAPLEESRRLMWDAVEVLVDFEVARDRLAGGVERELIWQLRERSNYRRFDKDVPYPLRVEQQEWVICMFRSLWPAAGHPSGVMRGDQNPWDASDYLFALAARLGEEVSDGAVAALQRLCSGPKDSYTAHLQTIAAEQARKRAESRYTPPTLDDIRAVVEAGMPVSSNDLLAQMLANLDIVQAKLRGDDVDWYRSFFDASGRHKNEEPCRDEIIKMLRGIDSALEYVPEQHSADDKRVDIVVRADKSLILPIEVKGQWHPELWTAADRQLDHLYVTDWRAEHGIYLVLWFGSGARLARPPAGMSPPATPEDLREALQQTSRAARDGQIEVVVLDLTRPLPAS